MTKEQHKEIMEFYYLACACQKDLSKTERAQKFIEIIDGLVE